MHRADRLLLDCLCLTEGEDAAWIGTLSREDWNDIIARSVCFLVMPQLYLGITRLGATRSGARTAVPEEVLERMQQLFFRNLAASVRLNHALSGCLGVLNAEGIPVAVLKGAHLGELVYRNVGARILSDIDLLVRRKDLEKAQRCLMRAGLYPSSGLLNIDLHWYLDTDYPIDMAGVWDRMQPAGIAGESVRVLSTEDLLLHLCLHLASHHQFRRIGVRTFCDIREIILRHGKDIDWDRLVLRASQWGMEKALRLTLAMTSSLLKVAVPERVLVGALSGKDADGVTVRAFVNTFEDTSGTPVTALSPYFWGIWTAKTFAGRLKNLRSLLMPSPEFVSQKYPAPCGTVKNFVYYFVRLKVHLLTYMAATWQMVTRESRMREIFKSERSNMAVKQWLLEGEGEKAATCHSGCCWDIGLSGSGEGRKVK